MPQFPNLEEVCINWIASFSNNLHCSEMIDPFWLDTHTTISYQVAWIDIKINASSCNLFDPVTSSLWYTYGSCSSDRKKVRWAWVDEFGQFGRLIVYYFLSKKKGFKIKWNKNSYRIWQLWKILVWYDLSERVSDDWLYI